MDPGLLIAAIVTTTLGITACVSTLLGWRMWLRSKTERLKLAGRDDIERLIEAVDALHERVHVVQDEMSELNERVDFAERLLAKGDGSGEPERPDSLVST